MSLFKRLSATLVSRVDRVVGEIENHSAVAQASIIDMRKKVAEAKVRLSQVQREGDKLKQQIDEQNENVERWRQRAIECAQSDEAKALQCVQRSRQCQQQSDVWKQSHQQYIQTAEKLAQNIETSESRLYAMQQKVTLMQARQSSNAAMHMTTQHDEDKELFLNDTFERWEINLTAGEMALDNHKPIDSLEHEFISKELEQNLRGELSMLIAEEKI